MKAIDFIYMALAAVAISNGFMMAIIGQGWAAIGMIIVGIIVMARTILS